MADSKQSSDAAQKGPGTMGTKYSPTAPSAPSFSSPGNSKAGGDKRGSQG